MPIIHSDEINVARTLLHGKTDQENSDGTYTETDMVINGSHLRQFGSTVSKLKKRIGTPAFTEWGEQFLDGVMTEVPEQTENRKTKFYSKMQTLTEREEQSLVQKIKPVIESLSDLSGNIKEKHQDQAKLVEVLETIGEHLVERLPIEMQKDIKQSFSSSREKTTRGRVYGDFVGRPKASRVKRLPSPESNSVTPIISRVKGLGER